MADFTRVKPSTRWSSTVSTMGSGDIADSFGFPARPYSRRLRMESRSGSAARLLTSGSPFSAAVNCSDFHCSNWSCACARTGAHMTAMAAVSSKTVKSLCVNFRMGSRSVKAREQTSHTARLFQQEKAPCQKKRIIPRSQMSAHPENRKGGAQPPSKVWQKCEPVAHGGAAHSGAVGGKGGHQPALPPAN